MKYLVSLSGGKDSTACLLWALNTFKKEDIVVYYIDTKWEHDSVYEYLDYLGNKLDVKILRIESEGMEALSIRKKMMPNSVMRFCTAELKIKPFLNFIQNEYINKNIDFINIVGIRREESENRANTESFDVREETLKDLDGKKIKVSIKTLYPAAYWDTQRIFDYHKENKIDVNPLYKKGFKRVGCYPCIYANKGELVGMEEKYRDRLRSLENKVGDIVEEAGFDRSKATFFTHKKDKYLRDTLNLEFDENHCVNQFGICE